ncbi:hypothetical protein PENTCL1PPCAC_19970, partial [Pristionchus entomophagus]
FRVRPCVGCMQQIARQLGTAAARTLLRAPYPLPYSLRGTVAPLVVVRRWHGRKKLEESADARLDREISDIQQRVKDYKKQLYRHANGSYKSRELGTSISNLSFTMADAQKRKKAASSGVDPNANTLANMPAHVSIEVLSNGTAHMAPCVAIRTPLKTYLFNAPEGTSRFLPALRLKPNNIYDIFLTRSVWQNISGISSIMMAKEQNSLPTRLHGAVNVKHFLECIRPFQDSDFGSVKYPSSKPDPDDPIQYPSLVEECTLQTHDSFEDPGLKIQYIPLLPDEETQAKMARKNTTDVAYYIEMKDPPRRIDLTRVIRMNVPKGPLIGKLKNGESITLPNGNVVTPEDVMMDDDRASSEKRRLLIVDAADEGYARSLYENTIVRSLSGPNAAHRLDFVVHLTPERVLCTEHYKRWAEQLGDQCTHIVANGSGPVVPAIDSMYKHARLLHELQPALFDELRPRGWRGLVTQERDLGVAEGRWLRAAPLQRWEMRPLRGMDPIVLDLKESDGREEGGRLALGEEWRETAKEELRAAREAAAALSACSTADSSFPRVTFLGTSSATPTKYRNVSGYLLEISASSAFLVDVGEATYGQLRGLLDDEACEELMLNLHAIFITHAHQDHMNGLYTVIEKRREAFEKRGLAYSPLVLVCNKNVMKPLKTYTYCFEDLESYVEVVDLATSGGAPPFQRAGASPPSSPKRARVDNNFGQTTSELIPLIPAEFYDEKRWGLSGVKAVQVHHTRMANGFVFSTTDGKKIVFSGDTKPCDLLVEHGMDADLLIHEATFEDGHEQDAFRKKHSTMGQAVSIAERMRAKHCILSHFSARYPKVPPLPAYLDEKKIGLAMDGLRVGFDRLSLVPLMTPIYRHVYRDDLFECELKKCQRDLKAADSKQTMKENAKKEDRSVKV